MNKQIEHISYNALNLPNRIKLAHEEYKYIDYTYLSDGTKLQKRTWANSAPTTTTDYVGSFVFENSTLDYVLMPEGRIVATANGELSYNYFLKDHLGNTRIVFSETGEVLQDESYYPFGMSLGSACSYSQPAAKENNYLYNGKELQSDFGLEWYDYGARMYDPQIARWHCPDPMSDYREWLSPYNYCQNNPINRIDPNGMCDDFIFEDDEGREIYRIETDDYFDILYYDLEQHENGGWYGGDMVVIEYEPDMSYDERGYEIDDQDEDERGGENVREREREQESNYNQNLITGLNGTNGTLGIVSTASAMTVAESAKTVKGISTVSKIGVRSGVLGLAVTGSIATYEYNHGKANTHTIVDVGIAVGVTIGSAAAMFFGAPVVASGIVIGGTIYGAASVMGMGDAMDDWTDNWGQHIFYGD